MPQRPIDDARDGGQHLDQRADRRRGSTAARARSGRGRSRSRAAPRGSERAERGDERADDELTGAEDLGDRVPGAVPDEARSRTCWIARPRPVDHLPDDPGDDQQHDERGERRSRHGARRPRSGRGHAVSGAMPTARRGRTSAEASTRDSFPASSGQREGLSPLRHITFTSCAPGGVGTRATLDQVNVVEPPHSDAPAAGRRRREKSRFAAAGGRADAAGASGLEGDGLRHRGPLGLLRQARSPSRASRSRSTRTRSRR